MLNDPIILELKIMKFVGMNFFGDPFKYSSIWSEENAIGQLWTRFGSFLQTDVRKIQNLVNNNLAYEIHIASEQMNETGEYEVFTGLEVIDVTEFPINCVAKVFPKTLYAEFTLVGEQITSDWTQWIYEGWLPHSGYKASAQYSIQVYDESFKGMDNLEDAVIKVLIPINKVGDSQ